MSVVTHIIASHPHIISCIIQYLLPVIYHLYFKTWYSLQYRSLSATYFLSLIAYYLLVSSYQQSTLKDPLSIINIRYHILTSIHLVITYLIVRLIDLCFPIIFFIYLFIVYLSQCFNQHFQLWFTARYV